MYEDMMYCSIDYLDAHELIESTDEAAEVGLPWPLQRAIPLPANARGGGWVE